MVRIRTDQKISRKKVSFSVQATRARQVVLVGDFNNWDTGMHPMKKGGGGIWHTTVMLSPGRYEYKFLIDGDWQEDPQNSNSCPNCFGTMNSIIHLSVS